MVVFTMTDGGGKANLTLAGHHLEQGRPAQALAALANPDADQLDDPHYWYLRATALHDDDDGQTRQAEAAARKGLALAPDSIALLYVLHSTASRRGDLAAAEEALLRALRHEPEDPQLLCAYALLTAKGGQISKAERLLERARRSYPEYEDIGRVETVLAYLRGADKDVVRSGQALLAANPDDILGHHLVGMALSAQGRARSADRHAGQAVRLDPTDVDLAESARQSRYWNHWLMIPMWPALRLGPAGLWLAAMGSILLLFLLGYEQLGLAVAIAWVVYNIYTWVVPPLLRRWLRRSGQRFG